METRSEMDILVPEEFLPLWEHNEQRPIVKYPAAVLRAKAKPVDRITKSTRDLVDRMREVMKSANGIGLAAPQLGTSLRIIVVSEGKRAIALINPVVVSSEGTVVAEEGCLSLPGLYGDVTRKAIVDVEALDSEGKRVRLRLEGLPARCVQHEIDHLDGVLFIDRADLPRSTGRGRRLPTRTETLRLAFFGTSAFAVPALLSLADHVDLVVTQPRRPSGRGNKLLPTPVGEAAAQLGIETLSPEKAKEESFVEVIEARAFDAMVVASYGQILSGRLLAASKRGGINLHASLLPQYRGAAPINHAILAGDTESGVTLMQMDRGMDTGDIIAQETIPIGTDETVGDLEMRLATLAAEMAAAWMPKIVSGDYSRVPQDHALATIAPKIKIADMLISFDESAETAYLRYRAFTPKPGARVTASGGRIKILRCRLGSEVGDPGTLLERHDSGIEVAFATGSLILESLQPDNKGPVSGNDYANGRRLVKGDRL